MTDSNGEFDTAQESQFVVDETPAQYEAVDRQPDQLASRDARVRGDA